MLGGDFSDIETDPGIDDEVPDVNMPDAPSEEPAAKQKSTARKPPRTSKQSLIPAKRPSQKVAGEKPAKKRATHNVTESSSARRMTRSQKQLGKHADEEQA